MPLTSQQLLDLVKLDPARTVGYKGILSGLRRQASPQQRPLIDAMLAVERPTRPERPRSPIPAVTPVRKPAPFSPSDVAWLQRLPLDPAAIAPADIEQLVILHAQAEPRSGDERLINSILDPVRVIVAKQNAQHDLAAVKAAGEPPAPPAALQSLLADAIQAEQPELADEAATRATRLIAQAHADVASARAERVAAAEQAVSATTAAA